MFQLPGMAIRVTLIILDPTGSFTIFGYIALWTVLLAISYINYKILNFLMSNFGKVASTVVYLFITPFTAVSAILIYAMLFVVFPTGLIVSIPSFDSEFVALWVGVAAYTFSLIPVPAIYLLLSTRGFD